MKKSLKWIFTAAALIAAIAALIFIMAYIRGPRITVIYSEDGCVFLEWENIDRASAYNVYKKEEGGSWFLAAEGLDTDYYLDLDTEEGCTYYYKIRSVLSIGINGSFGEETGCTVSTSASAASDEADDEAEPVYTRLSAYYQITYEISYEGGYELSVSDYNMGIKVIAVKEYLVNAGFLVKTWASNSDEWTTYDSDTESAVISFQTSEGLSATGIVDLETWLAMGFSEEEWYSMGAYVTPLKVSASSTKDDYIEAMVETALEYLKAETAYGGGCAGEPGTAVDCSGLILQCLYSAGIDPESVNVVSHAQAEHLFGSRELGNDALLGMTVDEPERGDLIFYSTASGTITHVALYIGSGYVIESQTYLGVVLRRMDESGSHQTYVRIFW